MSRHSKLEYQILAGWATLDYGITALDCFLEWLVNVKNINLADIDNDREIIEKVFYEARNLREEEFISSICLSSEFLSGQCEKAMKLDCWIKKTSIAF